MDLIGLLKDVVGIATGVIRVYLLEINRRPGTLQNLALTGTAAGMNAIPDIICDRRRLRRFPGSCHDERMVGQSARLALAQWLG